MRLCLLFTFAILCCSQCVQSAKILGVFPVVSYSHYTLGIRLMKELAARGHEVTMLSPYAEKTPIPNFKSVQLTGMKEDMDERKGQMNMFEMTNGLKFLSLIFLHSMGHGITELTLKHPNTQKILQSNEKFDLIVIEQFANEALRGICYHYEAPCVTVSAIASSYWTNLLVANPTNPSYIPEMVLNHAGPMNFYQRLQNTALALYTQALLHLYILPQQNALMHEFFPSAPHLLEILHNTSLVLVNSHVSNAQAVPLVPNMIEIGGYHPQTPKKLPEDLQKYLDGAKGGVVYFSMGSNLKSKDMSMEKRQAIINTFAKLKMKVLWKFEEELAGISANVKISSWLPQNDLLAHPNIKLFITHGGLLSTIEAIFHGVPVVGLPIFGDQVSNMVGAVNGGFAEMVDYQTITEESFSTAVNAVLTNKKYTENIKRRSQIMHDRPMKPMDTAMFWLEYVIRNKGAPELRSEAMNLTWYQYFLLDVIAFMAVISLGFLFIFLQICFIVKKLICSNKSNAKQVNASKKQK